MVGQICLLSSENALPPFWEKGLTRAIIMALGAKKSRHGEGNVRAQVLA